jgi:hypothetical protein
MLGTGESVFVKQDQAQCARLASTEVPGSLFSKILCGTGHLESVR